MRMEILRPWPGFQRPPCNLLNNRLEIKQCLLSSTNSVESVAGRYKLLTGDLESTAAHQGNGSLLCRSLLRLTLPYPLEADPHVSECAIPRHHFPIADRPFVGAFTMTHLVNQVDKIFHI